VTDRPSGDPTLQRIERMFEALLRHYGIDSGVGAPVESAIPAPGIRVGAGLPKAMSASDMMRAFGLTPPTFYRRQAAGDFSPFLLARAIGRKRYSGEKVQAFLNGRGRLGGDRISPNSALRSSLGFVRSR